MLRNKTFIVSFCIFVLSNIFIYIFIILFNNTIPFSKFQYLYGAYHYIEDPRIKDGQFNLLRALGQYDAQWYLRNAELGYPNDKHTTDGLSYAFDPFYPLTLRFLNRIFSNIELTAFIFTNVLLIVNFISLYYVVSRLYSQNIALKTAFLLFTFPFSIFYRSYFTEGLYLFLFIWFTYFLIKEKFVYSALSLGLMNITRGNGFFLNLFFLYALWQQLKKKKCSFQKAILSILLISGPLLIWSIYNYVQTGNPFNFYSVESYWFKSHNVFTPLLHNLSTILSFNNVLRNRDVILIVFSLFILIRSKKVLNSKLWLMSLLLWILPLLVKDTRSFSRFLIVIFPFFIYGASVLNKTNYLLALGCFYITLLLVSLYFVNWYWI